jgi:hypothetical protein
MDRRREYEKGPMLAFNSKANAKLIVGRGHGWVGDAIFEVVFTFLPF